jgi:hypothetical protein
VEAIAELNAVRAVDPDASVAAATAHRVACGLEAGCLPAVSRVIADGSLLSWTAPPPAPSGLSPPEGDATAVAAWWSSLGELAQQWLVATSSPTIGNLDGIPAADRDRANRAQLARDAAAAGPSPAVSAVVAYLESAAGSVDPRSGEPVVVQLYAYDPGAFGGIGIAAVAIGDLDDAAHVAVTVSGFDSDVAGMQPGESQRIYAEARRASGDSVAVLDWVGYDAPSFDLDVPGFVTGESAGLPSVVVELAGVAGLGAATDGAARLAAVVEGLRAMRRGLQPHVTVIGHSYGSTTAAVAADRFGLAADDLVLTGSPGAGTAGTADDLTTGAAHTWVASPSSDVVTMFGHSDGGIRLVGVLGNDPAMDTFGAVRVAAENFGRGTPWNPFNLVGEHQGQFADGSESLYNVAAIVVGAYSEVLIVEPRQQRPFIEAGWPPELHLWPDDPETRRAPTVVRHLWPDAETRGGNIRQPTLVE